MVGSSRWTGGNMTSVRDVILEAIERSGKTAYRALEDAGVNQSYGSRALNGKKPISPGLAADLARVLGLDADALLSQLTREKLEERDRRKAEREGGVAPPPVKVNGNGAGPGPFPHEEGPRVGPVVLGPSPPPTAPRLSVLDGLGGVRFPPTEEEAATLEEAETVGVALSVFTEPGFWSQAPTAYVRRWSFGRLRRNIEDERMARELLSDSLPPAKPSRKPKEKG